MPGESYRRWLRSLLLYLCYVFQLQVLINSLVCWSCLCVYCISSFQQKIHGGGKLRVLKMTGRSPQQTQRKFAARYFRTCGRNSTTWHQDRSLVEIFLPIQVSNFPCVYHSGLAELAWATLCHCVCVCVFGCVRAHAYARMHFCACVVGGLLKNHVPILALQPVCHSDPQDWLI